MFMRFWLAALFIVCVGGFVMTSGTVTVQAGELNLNMAALTQTMPVLVALAAPMITMSLVLMLTMTFGRQARRRSSSR
jgi:hypothetical protein